MLLSAEQKKSFMTSSVLEAYMRRVFVTFLVYYLLRPFHTVPSARSFNSICTIWLASNIPCSVVVLFSVLYERIRNEKISLPIMILSDNLVCSVMLWIVAMIGVANETMSGNPDISVLTFISKVMIILFPVSLLFGLVDAEKYREYSELLEAVR